MSAKQQLLDYAAKHNTNSERSNEAWLGQAITEGIVIERTPASMTVVNITKQGRDITVTETVKTQRPVMVDGRLTDITDESATVVMQLTL